MCGVFLHLHLRCWLWRCDRRDRRRRRLDNDRFLAGAEGQEASLHVGFVLVPVFEIGVRINQQLQLVRLVIALFRLKLYGRGTRRGRWSVGDETVSAWQHGRAATCRWVAVRLWAQHGLCVATRSGLIVAPYLCSHRSGASSCSQLVFIGRHEIHAIDVASCTAAFAAAFLRPALSLLRLALAGLRLLFLRLPCHAAHSGWHEEMR